jgi:hypothetical protein
MIFFERLFAAYYFLFLKFRKINKSRIEDEQAATFVSINWFLITIILLGVCQKFLYLNKTYVSYFTILVGIVLYFVSNKYFLSDRERRNRILDAFRELNKRRKVFWEAVSFLVIIIEVVVLIIVFLPN